METTQLEAQTGVETEIIPGTAAGAELPEPKKKRGWKKKQKDDRRFTKKKFPVGKVVMALIAIGAVGVIGFKMTHKGPTGMPVATVPLEKGDLVSAVNLTGIIESAEDAEVYAKTSGNVQTVNVKVGDRVEAGQLLAQLDTRDFLLQISQKQIAIEEGMKKADQLKKKNEFSINSADKNFDAARVDIAAGLNQELIAAETEVDRAQRALNAARRDYNDYKEDHDLADVVFKNAQRKLERASDAYRVAKEKLASLDHSDSDYAQKLQDLTKLVNETEEAYLTAKDAYNEADREYGSDLSSEAREYRNARIDYEKALKDRDATKNAIARKLDDLKDEIDAAELDAELETDFRADYLEIEQLQQKVSDSNVTAPISGTVTAVYAKEGAPAAGLMFIIEDMDNLIVKTAVKELDVGKVKTGMSADVKADATGEKVFPAQVGTISPTSKKDAEGNTVTSGSVEFETDVLLTEPDENLRVGMNVRVNVVTEEKKDVLSAPFDAVVSDAEGNNIIYTIETDAEGVSRAKSVPVTTGMETDFYVEIFGEGLRDGMPVISDPSVIQDGAEVINTSAAAGGADAAAMAG